MPLPRICRLFLFDLDGTLIDSREDIVRAVNATMMKMGLPAISQEDVVRFVGDGIEPLIRRVLLKVGGAEPAADRVGTGVKLMLEEYRLHLIGSTCLYPGVRETLAALQRATLGLISNKQEELCRRILAAFGLDGRFAVVMGGDSLVQRKPDPAPILHAMSVCGVMPAETVMVGDSPVDILSGKAAGAFTCGISSGFRTREELQAAGGDVIVDRFADLLQYFIPPAVDRDPAPGITS
jgi:phosphoglycolate phosphatase